jgi:hypothetical protein
VNSCARVHFEIMNQANTRSPPVCRVPKVQGHLVRLGRVVPDRVSRDARPPVVSTNHFAFLCALLFVVSSCLSSALQHVGRAAQVFHSLSVVTLVRFACLLIFSLLFLLMRIIVCVCWARFVADPLLLSSCLSSALQHVGRAAQVFHSLGVVTLVRFA